MMNLRLGVLAYFLLPHTLVGQEQPELLRVHGDLDREVLVNVKAAQMGPEGVAVLTNPTPAMHLFAGNRYHSWGRSGGGPAELSSPVDLAWPGSSLVVLDVGHRKVVTYDLDGSFVETRGLGDWANRMFLIDGDTILGMFTPMDRSRAVVRISDQVRDTIISYSTSSNVIRLEAPGAPSLTVAEPFTPQPQWTVLPDRVVAIWTPDGGNIRLIDLEGREQSQMPPVGLPWPVRSEDREIWLSHEIPEDFMGQRVFEPLRHRAREVVTFPTEFPPVMELQGDPEGGIWVRKTTHGTGQLWYLMGRDGEEIGSLRLPPRRRLLKAGADGLLVVAEDELGVERIEIYRRPDWAGM